MRKVRPGTIGVAGLFGYVLLRGRSSVNPLRRIGGRATIDGVRVEYADGFGLARASNTTPVIVLRFEADSDAALERIKKDFRKVLQPLKPNAPLPY